jgi:hypothetical protein
MLYSIYIIYNDYFFFNIIYIIGIIPIFDNLNNPLEISYFRKMEQYVIYKLGKYTLQNVILSLHILIINLVYFIIYHIKISISLLLHYTIHLFIIFEIIYLWCFSFQFLKDSLIKSYLFIFSCFIIHLFELVIQSNTIVFFNIFSCYFYNTSFWISCINYAFWSIIPLVIIFNKKDCVEL